MSRATQGEQDNYEMHVRASNIVSRQVEARPGLQPSGSQRGLLGGGLSMAAWEGQTGNRPRSS